MMLRNKILGSAFFLALLITLAWSCKEDDKFIPLKINSVTPSLVLVGDTISIFGEGFSADYAVNRIYFPSVEKYGAPIAGSTTSKLVVVVPDSATTGSIRINILNEEIFDSPSITITPPVFESITPNTGYVGDTIIIKGENFQANANSKNNVKFKGVQNTFPIATVVKSTGTELKVIVPEGAVAGNISVLGFQGPKFNFRVGKITKIYPTKGIVGDTISIEGIGFPEIAAIYFNQGVTAVDVEAAVNTSRQRYAIVPAEASNGKLRMTYTTDGGTASVSLLSDSIFQIYPSITDLSSAIGPPGYSLTIKGFSFAPKRAPAVNLVSAFINGVAIAVKSFDNKNIEVTIPASATTGQVKVIVNGRVALGPEFQVSAAGTPVLESLSKTEGFVGDEVIIYGQGFNPNIADNKVKIGVDNATIKAATNNTLTITVPNGAVTGIISVTSNSIDAVGDLSFTVKIPVIDFVINTVKPSLMFKQDDQITIEGSGFSTAGDISPYITPKFPSPSYRFTDMIFTSTEIKGRAYTYHDPIRESKPVYMPGDYDLTLRYNTTPTEDASEKKVITIQSKISPFINLITPSESKVGQLINISGEYFNGNGSRNTVTFTGSSTAVAEYVSFFRTSGDNNPANPTSADLKVNVPALAPGDYSVTVNNGVGQTTASFAFKINADEVLTIEPKPVYYLGQDGNAAISLKKITKDSPTPTTIFNAPDGITAMVVDVKTDIATSKVYFAEKSETEANHGIFSMKVDGTLKTRIVKTPKPVEGEGVDNTYCATISDLSLNAANSTLFWVKFNDLKISSAKTNDNPINDPVAVKSLDASKYYLTSGLTYSEGKLYTAAFYDNSIDGSTTSDLLSIDIGTIGKPITTIFDEADGLGVISDVKIDQLNGKLYILASGNLDTYTIYKSDLNGGSKQPLIQFEEGTQVLGISLDLEDKYIYFLQVKGGSQSSIGVARMDGLEITPGVKTQTVYKNLSFVNPGSGAGAIAVEVSGGGAAQRMGSMNMQLKYHLKKRK